jgi:Methyltransferase domain
MIPPNLRFLLDDAEDTWHYTEKFCLIHARMMIGSIRDWPLLIRRSFEQLRPGGYLELQDITSIECDDDSFSLDPPSCDFARWWLVIVEAFALIGRSVTVAKEHKDRLIEAGFTDVTELNFKWPNGPWPRDPFFKEIGLWSRENMGDALESLALAPLTRMGWSMDRIQQLIEGARRDLRDRSMHTYWRV